MGVTGLLIGNCYVNVMFYLYLASTNDLKRYINLLFPATSRLLVFFGTPGSHSQDICTKRRDLHGEGQGYTKRCMLIYVTQLSFMKKRDPGCLG